MEIIIKNFQPHYNTALGKVVTNERQYKEEMKRGGYIPYEQAQEIVEANKQRRSKFSASDECVKRCENISDRAKRGHNRIMSDSDVDFLKRSSTLDRDNPAFKEAMDSRLPEHYRR